MKNEQTVRIYPGGTKYWYLDNKRHRTDGPAVKLVDGDKYWYLNGKLFSEEEYNEQTNLQN